MTPDRIINRDPNHVRIFDTTLRDGFQSPGVNVGPENRFRVAQLLANMRVDIIEAGFPASSRENFDSVRAIASGIDGPVICALARANPEDIDRAWEAIEPAQERGGARIHIFIATSEIHMRDKLKMTPEQVLGATRESVRRAKKLTNDIEFSPEDATRSDFDFMMRVVLEAVDAGATTINIPDTVGYAQPPEYADRIREVRYRIDRYIGRDLVVISTHCHDDLGLAVANTLAGVMAGARQVEVAINGIGERAGNTSFEEVVAALRYRPDFYIVGGIPLSTQIDPLYVYQTSEYVEKVTGMIIAPNKAVVGRNAFAHESGIHAAGVIANSLTYEIMTPEIFGNRKTEIVIGAESGHSAIVARATKLGFKIADRTGLTTKVKEYANSTRRSVSDTELERIAAAFIGEDLTDVVVLGEFETGWTGHISTSTVNLVMNGNPLSAGAWGEDPIQSVVQAIKYATGLEIDLTYSAGKSLDTGAEAKAEVKLTVKDGIEVTAYAEDNDSSLAVIKAYIAALNTISRINTRQKSQSGWVS